MGDTPVIGAGCYANNKSCAVSGTGDGELFIMTVAAHDVSALVEYGGKSVREATQIVLDKIAKLGGTGGLIAIDLCTHTFAVCCLILLDSVEKMRRLFCEQLDNMLGRTT